MIKLKNILFVDDDAICSFLNITLVEELNLADRVLALQNAQEALDYVQKHYSGKNHNRQPYPDLLFLDLVMPGMDGYEFLEALDKLPNIDYSRFLIILLTASLHPQEREKAACHNSKVYTCLPKPLTPAMLEQLLQELEESNLHTS